MLMNTSPLSSIRLLPRIFVLTAGLLIGSLACSAAELDQKNFNLAADDATVALRAYAEQAGREIIYAPGDVRGVRTNAVKGGHTARAALELMLAGTELTAKVSPSGIFSVVRIPSGKNAPSRPADSAAAEEAGAKIKDGVVQLDTFEVMGSKLLNMDIPRSRDDAQPYVIFNRDTLTNSGATSLEDFFRQRLPQNAAMLADGQAPNPAGAASTINLRGLGPNQTLILVDGRRMAGTQWNGSVGQPDVNGIPLSAIERIEVLPTTASGIYGGSATGGVINIVMRRDYAGLEIKGTYDNTFDTDTAIKRIDANAGFTLEGGKTNILIAGSWSTTNTLLIQDRGFQAEGIKRILANNPNYFTDENVLLPSTTNLRSANGLPLVLKPQFGGTALNSLVTHVPYGYAGPSSDKGAALVANAGKLNYDPADSILTMGRRGALIAAPQRKSIMLTARRQFTPWLQLFGEYSLSLTETKYPVATDASPVFTLQPSVPTNPFTNPVRVFTNITVQSAAYRPINRRSRLAGGAIVKLPFEWNGTVDYSYDESSNKFSYSQVVPAGATTARFNSGEFDPFRDVTRYPIDVTSLMQELSVGEPQRSKAYTAAARASGPVGSLPAGRPTVSLLIESRGDKIPAVAYTSVSGAFYVGRRSQYTESAYFEAEVPIVSPTMKIPFMKQLSAQLAGRTDRYEINGSSSGNVLSAVTYASTSFSSQDPTIGFRWVVNPSLMLRASYGTGYLPPSVTQLTSTAPNTLQPANGVFDLKRGNQPVVGIPYSGGGTQSLKPERSESRSVGVVITPKFVPGLRVSIDWNRTEKRDNIAGLGTFQNYVVYEDYIPAGAVVRAAPIPGDGYSVGPITRLNLFTLNLARAEVETYDVQLDYTRDLGGAGKLEAFALATRAMHYKTQLVSALPVLENVGYATQVGGSLVTNFPSFPLKWRGNAGVTWSRGPLSVGWVARYYSSVYLDTRNVLGNARIIAGQGNNGRVDSQLYHDVFATYRFGAASVGTGLRERASRWLSRTEVQAGVRNIFNTWPPFDATNLSRYYFSVGDPRLASYYVSLKKAF